MQARMYIIQWYTIQYYAYAVKDVIQYGKPAKPYFIQCHFYIFELS